ncbi:helix-turn-helix domain-containing protein [Chitinophaga sancti]|uniref:AraC-type DNA-binding protein n=1 Tax=Chitinophaga sancti TaxID=1004 RepID=A0A1K1SHS4_9BACT|nr:helix-turn-helix transcriptional regulator [Chitinophaga sancti]WQD59885.1 helix-turn-helix transcriptional regulator [Chitinophaga sancti]WQG87984.1 helix-turn-helix transcriptional regulator [Chitinophaga sancti]SFW83445.1 AraC-type DNA-binding protein [Chitinophaga sancti]
MILKKITPKPELAKLIDNFWVFENDAGLPTEDSRIIVPNGKAKFIYTYLNGLSTIDGGIQTDHREHDIFFIGIWDKPVTLVSGSKITGTIGIELTPNGLHRFTQFSALEIVNKIYSFIDIYGAAGRQLQERLANTGKLEDKIDVFQNFLIRITNMVNRNNLLVDHSVQLIKNTSGLLTINQLVDKMGYSKRYLDMLFKEHLGISPKTYACLVRFQLFYTLWANTDAKNFYQENIYDVYYDQAHFIKEFKRYTGYSPRNYAQLKNEFGKLFYKK